MSSNVYEFSDEEDNSPGCISSSYSRKGKTQHSLDFSPILDSSDLNLEISVSDEDSADDSQAQLSQAPRWAKTLFDEMKKSKADTDKQIAALASLVSQRDQQNTLPLESVPRNLKIRISHYVRLSYQIIQQSGMAFDFNSGGFTAEKNKKVAEEITDHIMAEHDWDKKLVFEAIKVYFKSLRDASTRAKNQTETVHRKRCRRNSSIARKMKRRKSALSRVTVSPPTRERWGKVITRDFTSSDEEDGEDMVVRKLRWESTHLSDMKKQLDTYFTSTIANAQQKRLMARNKRKHNVFSSRRCPIDAPDWVQE